MSCGRACGLTGQRCWPGKEKYLVEERCHSMMSKDEVVAAVTAKWVEPSRSGVPTVPHCRCHHRIEIESCSPGSRARRSLREDRTLKGTCSPQCALHQVVTQYLLALSLARRRICAQSPNKYGDESSE
ncbi:hypothetical protein Scep_014526 [Stephania cephalantha]|uniref:Uncharacterized protein n=1 Tax=Stephania cephalantha TaxID=152367 RepID=A0AAP0P1T0_9MAGN